MKTVYAFETNGGHYVGHFDVKDSASLPFATEVSPGQRMLEVAESCGPRSLKFDRSTQEWSYDRDEIVRIMKARSAAASSEIVRNGAASSLLKYVVADLAGCASYPLPVTVDGETTTYESSQELRQAFASMIAAEAEAARVGDVVVNGGSVAGVEVAPIDEQTIDELSSLSPEEAVLQVVDLIEMENGRQF